MAEHQYKHGFVDKSVNYYKECAYTKPEAKNRGMKSSFESGPSRQADLNHNLGEVE